MFLAYIAKADINLSAFDCGPKGLFTVFLGGGMGLKNIKKNYLYTEMG